MNTRQLREETVCLNSVIPELCNIDSSQPNTIKSTASNCLGRYYQEALNLTQYYGKVKLLAVTLPANALRKSVEILPVPPSGIVYIKLTSKSQNRIRCDPCR
jgi:hypothetical protein